MSSASDQEEVLFREVQQNLKVRLLFFLGRLVFEVRRDGFYYRFLPLHLNWHKIPYPDIKTVETRTCKPIGEYGGWGIRCGFRKETAKAYTLRGHRGVQLELKDGKKILYGSQEPEKLAAAIEQAMKGADS
jgi:hypothetical protein